MTKPSHKIPRLTFRNIPSRDDPEKIRAIVEATDFFSDEEVEISVELVRERLLRGIESGYYFLFAEDDKGNLIGYTCYGPVTGTESSFDLYWIVVENNSQGYGIGKLLDSKTVDLVREMAERDYMLRPLQKSSMNLPAHFTGRWDTTKPHFWKISMPRTTGK